MNSGANRFFDRSTPKSLALGNNSRLYLAITAIFFRVCVFFLVVTLVSLFQVVVIAAAEDSNSGGLVAIGGGRKIYLQCHGTGSPAVVLISGTRGAHDDWTDLIDPKIRLARRRLVSQLCSRRLASSPGCAPTTAPELPGTITL
jgi:hypothetical protein